jgi:hypothetical protein
MAHVQFLSLGSNFQIFASPFHQVNNLAHDLLLNVDETSCSTVEIFTVHSKQNSVPLIWMPQVCKGPGRERLEVYSLEVFLLPGALQYGPPWPAEAKPLGQWNRGKKLQRVSEI